MKLIDKNKTWNPPAKGILQFVFAQGSYVQVEYMERISPTTKKMTKIYLNADGREVLRTEEIRETEIPAPPPLHPIQKSKKTSWWHKFFNWHPGFHIK